MFKNIAAIVLCLTPFTCVMGAKVHTSALPQGIDKATQGLIYLEPEKENKDDTFTNEADKSRTFFRTDAKPSDFWSTQVSYTGTRCVGRGSDSGSYKNINLYWEQVTAPAAAAEYEVFAWILCSNGETSTQTLGLFTGKARDEVEKGDPAAEATSAPKASGWLKLGKVTLGPENNTFRLRVSTEKSTVRLDTVLLAPVQERRGVSIMPRNSADPSELDGHIFTASTGALRVVVSSPEKVESGTYTIKNEEGQPIMLSAPLNLPKEQSAQVESVITLPTQGYYDVTVNVTYRDGQSVTDKTTAGVLGPPLDENIRKESRYGIWNVHGPTSYVVAAGGRWNRQMMSFRVAEKSLIDNAPAGTGVRQPSKSGLDDIGVFSFGFPLWLLQDPPATEPTGFARPFTKPKSWDELSALVRAYVLQPDRARRYPYLFEVWNEPEWAWKGTEEDLVKVHDAVAAGLKAAFPDTKVVGPCFSSLDLSKLDRLVQRGLLKNLDGLSMHSYVSGTAPEGKFIEDVRALKSYMKKIGREQMPIYFTEYGWTSRTGTWATPVNDLEQAQYCARSLGLLTHEDITSIIYFCLLFNTPKGGEAGFSVINPDLTPKPAYVAFSTAAHWLAGTSPEALLEIAPDTYLLTLKRGQQTIAMIWNSREKQTLRLPVGVVRAADMMGRPVSLGANAEATIGPSPIYLELSEGGFDRIATNSMQRTQQGKTLKLQMNATWCPPPLSADGASLKIPDGAPFGQYLVFSRASGNWQATPIRVVKPVQIESAVVSWPADAKSPVVDVVTQSAQDDAVAISTQLAAKNLQPQQISSVTLAAGATINQRFMLNDAINGTRYSGKVTVNNDAGKPLDIRPVNILILPCQKSDSANVQWQNITPMMIQDRTFVGNAMKNVAPEDCSARMQLAYSQEALHLRVMVRDNEHRQTQEPRRLWQEDSLQLAFDLDADKPLQANFGGWNGHERIFEIGVGGDLTKTSVYRWLSYDPEITQETEVHDMPATVTRQGDITTYELTMPWRTLGLAQMPVAGSSIGFAMVVNDRDAEKDTRHGVMLFDGISGHKDPAQYGRIWLRP